MIGRVFLGRYEAQRLLGEGGMGRVYLARQVDLGRQVVVKVMHDHIAADPRFQERFYRETKLMARLQHPYIVTLIDASLHDPEGPCIVMEYIKGIPLDTLLQRNHRLSPQRVSRLLNQLCEALQLAHSEGIIHRDLKPANLMVVDPDTPFEKIKVMDFGLAKIVNEQLPKEDRATDTGADFAVGTPGYISPEQVRGDGLDHRSDLYSVGVIVYELLTGRLPFSSKETMDVLIAHATEEPPSFNESGVDVFISPAVERVVMACLAKHPDDRPQSGRALAEMFDQALAEEQASLNASVHRKEAHKGSAGKSTPSVSDSTPIPAPFPNNIEQDPNAVVHQLQAWMPEAVAAHKLQGFVYDVGGKVVESVPGRIRVRLGGRGSMYDMMGGPLSWLGLGRKASQVDMELQLHRNNPDHPSFLSIVVIMRCADSSLASSPAWRSRCNEIFCDLRGYLMGSGVGTGT